MTRTVNALEATRRSFLTGAAASISGTARVDRAAWEGDSVCGPDPVVSLWRDWLTAHRAFGEACRRQQALETELLRTLGSFPRVKIDFADGDGSMWAYSEEDIKRLLSGIEQAEARRTAREKLAVQVADWNAGDARIGYMKAKQTEAEAADLEDALSDGLWSSAPRSVAGVAAKLHCVLETEDPGSGLQEAPWPQLRAILADLVRMGSEYPE
jgi:hypothetical protein